MSTWGPVRDNCLDTHATLLSIAVESIDETSPDLARLYANHPDLRSCLYATWKRQAESGATVVTDIALSNARIERFFHRQNCVAGSDSHGRLSVA